MPLYSLAVIQRCYVRVRVLPTHYSSVGSESAPHFNIGPCGRGFELSQRRKKRAIGTRPYSPVSEWSPPAGRPRGGALTIKGAFFIILLWDPGLGR